MNTFSNLGVASQLVTALEHLQITTPTPVQEQAIPQALQGLDLLVSAQTGTGKTYAYLLPVITRLLAMPKANALIIAPTRELALQIQQNLNKVNTKAVQMRTAMLIGGQAMGPQFGDLRRNPRIVIGTPGRINDHLERGSLALQDSSILIVDEFDRMLDMGFERQLETIRMELPEVRQTLLFSATMPHNVVRMVQNYTQNPVRITVGAENTATLNVKQEIVKTSMADKFTQLLKELDAREGSAIIFVRTQRKTEELSEKLKDENHQADAMHGGLRQQKRERVLQSFRNRRCRIIVATDVAARGIDVPHIQHVINYDLPECAEDYIHRIGRTGRAGAQGSALSFICPQDGSKWRSIYKLMNTANNPELAHLAPQGRDAQGGDSEGRSGYGGRPRSRSGSGFSRFGRSSGGSRFEGSRDRSSGSDERSGGFKPRRFSSEGGGSRFGNGGGSRFGGRTSKPRSDRDSDSVGF